MADQSLRWIKDLDSVFRNAGLEVLANDRVFRDVSKLPPYQDVAFMMWEELQSKMTKPYVDEYASILAEARTAVNDTRRGISINMEIRTVVGRKI